MMPLRIGIFGMRTAAQRIHNANMIAATASISIVSGTLLVGAAPKNGLKVLVGVGVAGEPVPCAVVVEQLSPWLPPGAVPGTSSKFAQLMRVLFWKWKTKLRLPKNEPRPGKVEEKSST
jgi:hypothetical protein